MAKRSKVQSALVCLGVLSCVLTFASAIAAQSFYGSIVGTATDKSGAVLPGTTVTLANIGTNDHQTAQTDTNGGYRFLNLVPGRYTLVFEKQGFQKLTRNNIELDVQAAVRIDAALQVGQVTESVEVSTATPLLDTENATVSQVIESQVVQDTPLNGRNVDNLIEMAPGVVPQQAAVGPAQSNNNSGTQTLTTAWSNYQIGGGMANQNAVLIDGVPINRPDGDSAAIPPTQDAVQEFRVESNNLPADSGRTAGGVINMTSKSGTNTFHGGVYDYIQNTNFNANAFFNNRLGVVRPEFIQNQYGAFVGGPIKRNKLFAFASFENPVYRLGGPTLFTVPTAAELAGDFSDPALPKIYDPLTVCSAPGYANYGNAPCGVDSKGSPIFLRQQFPGNKIPASRIDPAAQVLRTYWAPPTGPGYTNNYAVNQHIEGDEPEENFRLDWTVNDKQRAFAHYTNSHGSTSAGDPFFKGLVGNTLVWNNQLVVLGDTYIFSPKTIGDLRLGYLRFHQPAIGIGVGQKLAQFGPEWAKLASQVTFQGWPQTSQTAGIFGFFEPSITYDDADTYSINADITRNFGRHSVKVGGEARRIEWYYINYGAGEGTFSFNANFTAQNALSAGSTGHTMASFLLGFPGGGSANWNINSSQYQYYNALYAEDSFKATGKLQVVYGVRWDVSPGQWAEKHGNAGIFDPNATDPLGSSVGLPLKGQIEFVSSQNVPTSSIHPSKRDLFAPRVGVTYLLSPNTVVRTGYSILYVPTVATTLDAPQATSVATGLTNMVTSLNGGVTPAATYQLAGGAIVPTNGYVSGSQSAGTLSAPFPTGLVHASGRNQAALTTAVEGGSITAPFYNVQFPNMQQWNLSIENQSLKGILVGVAYVGSKGTHLGINGNPQLNQLADQYDICGTDKTQPQCSYQGAQHLLTDQVPNPFYGKLPTSAGAFATSSTLAVGQLLRPYPQFQNVINPATYLGGSTYHALQIRAERRFGSAGVLGGNLSWAKLLSNTDSLSAGGGGTGAVQDWYNLNAEKSLVAYDVPVRAVIRYVYPLPFGKGAKFLNSLNGVTDRLVSGWGFDGVTTFQGGKPLLFTATPNTLSNFGVGTLRPNFVQGCNLRVSGSPVDRLNQWFNTSCFTAPSSSGFGNMDRADGTVRAQGIDNFDMALSKKTAVWESATLELRVEAFNLFNHPVFNPPGTQFGAGGGAFGATQAAVASQVNQPRALQIAAKLTF
jgi:hypothetical protein